LEGIIHINDYAASTSTGAQGRNQRISTIDIPLINNGLPHSQKQVANIASIEVQVLPSDMLMLVLELVDACQRMQQQLGLGASPR